jgi:hypothetical protein
VVKRLRCFARSERNLGLQITQELRPGFHPRNQQKILRSCARGIQQVPFCVVDFFQIRFIRD